MFDRLVRGTVLSVAHRVMRKDENSRQFHERSKPDGGPEIVAEYEKCCAKGPHLRQREPIQNRSHRMFSNTEMQVLATRAISLKISCRGEGQCCFVRRTE